MTQVTYFGHLNLERKFSYFEGGLSDTAEMAAEALRREGAKGPFTVLVYDRTNVNTTRDIADLEVVLP